MPGRRQQMPRTSRSMRTPACEASYRAADHFGILQRVHLEDQVALALPLA